MEIFPEPLIKTALPQPQLLWHSAQGTVRRARTSFCRTKSQPCLAKPQHLVMWASGSASRLLRGNHLQGTWGPKEDRSTLTLSSFSCCLLTLWLQHLVSMPCNVHLGAQPLSWGTLLPLDRILQVRDPGPGQRVVLELPLVQLPVHK